MNISKHITIPILIAWMALIFFMSHQVATTSSGMSGYFVEPIKPYAPDFTEDILTTLVRKSAHIFMYFVLGILIYLALQGHRFSNIRLIIYSILSAFVYAVTDEIHQMFVPGRSGEVRDIMIDTIGASIGILICYLLMRKKDGKDINDNQETTK